MVVSGKIDEVNAREMGTAYLTIDVLDGLESFLRVVEGDGRAGMVERKNGTASTSSPSTAAPTPQADLLATLVREGSAWRRSPRGSARGWRNCSSKVGAKEVS